MVIWLDRDQMQNAQISDTHISPHGHFVEESFNWAINDVNKL